MGSSYCLLMSIAIDGFCAVSGKALGFCLVFLSLACCFAQDAKPAPGSIAGEVFNIGADGQRAVVPGAHIKLNGPVERQTESDGTGQYRFELLPAGRYTAEATAPGLAGRLSVDVATGETAAAAIPLELTTVTSSVTVTATESAVPTVSDQSAQSTTISQTTVEAAPNVDEKVESLLPLVPGVVRGPDGRINMKGARSTQGGWLVNSANVTDPATGAEAMNLPIDVVSSVQVISNPYDPEYGRFTGAVSSVETKTGSLDKYHLSIQNLFPRLRDRDGDIVGLESVTPRLTFTGPLVKNRIAITQSFEYRFVRTPVQSLPAMQRDMKLESLDSFTQADISISDTHSATLSVFGLSGKAGLPGTKHIHAAGIDTRPPPARLSGRCTGSVRVRGERVALLLRSASGNMTPIFCRTALLHTGCSWRLPKAASSSGRTAGANASRGRRPIRPVSAVFSARTRSRWVSTFLIARMMGGLRSRRSILSAPRITRSNESSSVRPPVFRLTRMKSPGSPAISGGRSSGWQSTWGCGSIAIRSPIPPTPLRGRESHWR